MARILLLAWCSVALISAQSAPSPGRKAEARGVLKSEDPGLYRIDPGDTGRAVQLLKKDAESPPELLLGMPVRVQGFLDAQRVLDPESFSVDLFQNVDPAKSKLRKATKDAITALQSKLTETARVSRSIARFADWSDVQTAPEFAQIEQLRRQAKKMIAGDYVDAARTQNRSAASETLTTYARLRLVEKAIYRHYDNYAPESYRQIFQNSYGGAAIAFNGLAECSGVLIGRNLVLTAGHCFKGREPEEADIWFNYSPEGISPGSRALGGRLVVGTDRYTVAEVLAPSRAELKAGQFSESLPDFTLLRIAPASPQNGDADANWPIQCLHTSTNLDRGDAVYLIGHPMRAPRTVHDNSRVVLPFEIDAETLNVIQTDVASELEHHPDRDRLAAAFVSSYRPGVNESQQSVYRLYDVRQGNQPRMGLETDTFEGNSGSPVYDRNRHCLVGLLVSGAPDFTAPPGAPAGWARHESALPIGIIVRQLDARAPGWRDRGVVVK